MANTQTANKRPDARQRNQSRAVESGATEMVQDLVEYLKEYAREKPEMAALWCFGIGFVLGWKLKPW